jgi:two-component system, LytTR family, response regulator
MNTTSISRIKAIAIDDEPSAIEVIDYFASKTPFVELLRTFNVVSEALSYIYNENIDVVFLDIQMPDMLGTDFAKLIQNRGIMVIFTTAHSQYAIEGYNLQVLDYLLKPIEYSRFLQACNRAYERLVSNQKQESSIFVKDGHDWVRVNLNEVLYIQSDTNLLFIHEKDRKITTRMTVAEMLNILPNDIFVRTHKSFIVSLKHIQKIERHQITVQNIAIPLAGSYKEVIENRLLKR